MIERRLIAALGYRWKGHPLTHAPTEQNIRAFARHTFPECYVPLPLSRWRMSQGIARARLPADVTREIVSADGMPCEWRILQNRLTFGTNWSSRSDHDRTLDRRQWARTGIGVVDVVFSAGQSPASDIRRSIELFGREVLPRIHAFDEAVVPQTAAVAS